MITTCDVCHRDIHEVTILDYDGYSICSDCEDQQYEYSGSPEHMAKQAELGHIGWRRDGRSW